MRPLLVLAIALALDVTLGDLPGRWHPVAWIGALIARGREWLACPHHRPFTLVVSGGIVTGVVTGLAAATAAGLVWMLRDAGLVGLVVQAVAVKQTLALRGLVRAGRAVAAQLRAHDLDAARGAVGRHLVSRATGSLDEARVASAAVESVAENLTDAVVAPVVFFLVGGLPGAAAYRAVNTADAMIGYREGVLEHFGKAAARLDDLMNLVPARLAGVAIVLAAVFTADAADALRAVVRDHARTASPNAGWTMAAMAGALGVTLEKPGAYRLGTGPLPAAHHVDVAIRVMLVAAALATMTAAAVAILV